MKPVLIIAGGGPSGRAIAERMATRWLPTVVDVDAEHLKSLDSESIDSVVGDCTSTLVLRQTPIERAGAVVAATGSDEVNFEFCRLAREQYSIKTIVALVNNVDQAERFRAADFIPITRPSSAAVIVETQLDSGRRTTADIGLGLGEIMEVTVQSHSPVIGKSMVLLRPISWLLAAIYRDGKLVVPHGDTEIEENDRCLLIGDPAILPDIADYFQRGASEFPLQFGTRYAVLDEGDPAVLEEARYLLEHTNATGIRQLVKHGTETASIDLVKSDGLDISAYTLDRAWPQNLSEVGDSLDVAAHLLKPKPLNWWQRYGLSRRSPYEVMERTSEPVVICRGTHPYKKVLLAVSPGPGSLRVAELAVDVARKFEVKLHIVAACPPEFVTGSEFRAEAEEALERAAGVASLYGLGTRTEILEGNEVHQICERAGDCDLLIVGHRRQRNFSYLKPDVSLLIASRSPVSTLVLPYLPRDLGRAYTRRGKKKST